MDNIIPFPGNQNMHLEHVETLCINYLEQSKNPLAPLATLLDFCKRDEQCATLDQKTLLDFLSKHERFVVLPGMEPVAAIGPKTLQEAGILMGPRVALKERIPTEGELMLLFKAQLDDMKEKLNTALAGLKEKHPNSPQQNAFETTLARIDQMREKIQKLDRR